MKVRVVRGKGRGKRILGFATANSVISKNDTGYGGNIFGFLSGKEGSWYVRVYVNNIKYFAICGISNNSSGGKWREYILETHIIDFNEDIYDKDIQIELIYKIRNQIIFKSLDESKEQIIKDIDFARNYKSCDDCKFCVYQDHGYSNYTVEGTNISCLADMFDDTDSYSLGMASTCQYFNEGDHWSLDVDGDEPRPSDDWVKSELRNIKIRKIIE